MTVNCFILHTPDLKFANSAGLLFFLPSNVSHRMLEAAGKAAGMPATTQGQDVVGLISAHSWLKYPCAAVQEDVENSLAHMGCDFCLPRLNKQAPRQNIAFFFQ